VIGLAVSIVLLGLITPLLLISYDPNERLDTIGLLQVVWIMARHKPLTEEIGETSKPDTDVLRQKGMVTVCPVCDD
jgi:hypothetical protein